MTEQPRGRLLAYSKYQLQDYLLHRAALPCVLVATIAGVTVYSAHTTGGPDVFSTPFGKTIGKQIFTQDIGLFLPIGAFLAVAGMLSQDRQLGHYRLLFSKPVNVLMFYAQAFLLHGLTFVALAAVIAAAIGALTVPAPVLAAAQAAGLTFLLIGGLGFLFGSLTRLDGALLLLVYLLGSLLQQIRAHAPVAALPRWLDFAASVLPPVYKLDEVRARLFEAQAADPAQLWHVIAYGAGAFLLGLFILRKAPLAR